MSTLEQKWGRYIVAKTKSVRYLGVNVTSMWGRQRQFWEDLSAVCREFWSMSIKMDMDKVGHIHFTVRGPGGSDLGVLITGPPDAAYLDLVFGVSKGDFQQTFRNKFSMGATLQSVVEYIDRTALKVMRGK